jgi:hypothetical protein
MLPLWDEHFLEAKGSQESKRVEQLRKDQKKIAVPLPTA